MKLYPDIIERLLQYLMKFPGIGRRSAERIVYYIINASKEEINSFSRALLDLKDRIRYCKICNNLTDAEICNICQDNSRNQSLVCTVEEANDVLAIEKSAKFKGVYHVLGGRISPLDGKGPESLKIKELLTRIQQNSIKEIIIATGTDIEGEATAIYLSNLLKPLGVRVSRIASGVPLGTNLEYTDASTLALALEGRREI
ncbi:MAG: recombination mediator RecR [Candidatus Omnitrophota bacterium]